MSRLPHTHTPRSFARVGALVACWLAVAMYNVAAAQPVNKPWAGTCIAVDAGAGKVWKHEPKFTLPIPALSRSIDISLLKHTYGQKPWQQARKYPTVGAGLHIADYGIDSIYGKAVALYPCLEVPLVRGQRAELTLRVGDGIAYVSRQYSRVNPTDTVNVAIGSRLNDFAMVNADLRYKASDHWHLQLGAHATHISNASFRKPNLGVNTWGIHLGVRYYPVTANPQRIMRKMAPIPNRWLTQARVGMTMVSAFAPGGPLYPAYVASVYESRRWRGKNKAFAGLDYSYHGDVYAYLRNNSLQQGAEVAGASKSAVFAGNEFLLGRVGIVVQAGVYLKQNYFRKDPVYEKVGANLYLLQREQGAIKELFFSVFLKTHQNVAEMGEVGLGVGF